MAAGWELWRLSSEGWNRGAKVEVARVAGRQFGRIGWGQLEEIGIGKATITRWIADGYLHRTLPGVYAVGHRAPGVEASLVEALLYAGPEAALSHGTAAWWFALLDKAPTATQLSTPRRCRSLRGVRVHDRRAIDRVSHRALPVTSVPQTLLDFAASAGAARTRFVLANAEYRDLLDLAAAEQMLGRGRPGSRALRAALKRHQPLLGCTRSAAEQALIGLCERHRLPLPECNVRAAGWVVDALWRSQRVIVEVDGHRAHRTRAQLERDHERDLKLRAAGFVVVRYSYRQLTEHGGEVARELLALLNRREPGEPLSPAAPSGGPGSR